MSADEPSLSEDELITAPFLSGPARVKRFRDKGGYYLLEVTLEESGEFLPKRLTPDQVAQIEVLSSRPGTLSDDPEEFFLAIEARRIRLAHQFDPMLAVSVSQVDPLPHQIEAVYRHALEQPQLRFMIADDPGAGKTIMAGLILREMQARGLVRRVLIVSPGHLKPQWQREMKEKFGQKFSVIDRSAMRAEWGENIWEERPQAITSIDFAKQDDIRATLKSGRWDLVIVDEAHKMSATAYETKDRVKVDKTKRYQLGELLSRRTDHLLFLTATPHRGRQEDFRLFLDLLQPGFFANTDLMEEAVRRDENPLFIRRLKEDMKKFDGTKIFPPRHVKTAPFRLTDPEQRLYNDVTRYVKHHYDQAKENRHVAFAMMILQRRVTSSAEAILRSLQRRQGKLEDLLHRAEKLREDEQLDVLREAAEAKLKQFDDLEDLDDYEEAERTAIEEKLEQVTVAQNIDDLRAEIQKLAELVDQAERVKAQGVENKLVKLRDAILSQLGDKRLLIFTEHKDTVRYLTEKLREWGYRVCVIHGGMDLDARIAAEKEFRHEAQIMVATEAAGEGINLQFCSWMVNYDLPWNPNRLEQRMGRIHRYGQNEEVFIWNLISRDTREGQVLEKLFDKLERMREAMGTDRVFDVIGEVIQGEKLGDVLREAALGQRRMEEIEERIEALDEEESKELLDQIFMTSLATEHIDYTGLERMQLEAKENRLVPAYVQDFFLRGFRRLEGEVAPIDGGFRVESVPYELRRLNDDYDFKTRYGKVRRRYARVTFEKEVAREDPEFELVAPGHPLLEALNEVVLEAFGREGGRVALFEDPEGDRSGAIWFVSGEVTDGLGQVAGRRVFALYRPVEGEIERVNPAVLWDLQPAPDREAPEEIDELLEDRDTVEDYVMAEVLFPYREEIEEKRARDAEVKRRYGLTSLEQLIGDSNAKLVDYETRAAEGEDMGAAIRQERRRLEEYEHRKETLEREIELETQITVSEPRVLGVAGVMAEAGYPLGGGGRRPTVREGAEAERETPKGGAPMARDDEIEAVGMRVATEYEEGCGWTVKDVSQEKHGGFDLRSMRISEDGRIAGVRYIEVKARARTGAIRLTANEWKMARQFGEDYWLYIVTNAGTDEPNLTRRQNPAGTFREEEDIFATGFEIPEESWREHNH